MLTGAVMALSAQWWIAAVCGVIAVVFGLEAAGVEVMGRTRRVVEQRREG